RRPRPASMTLPRTLDQLEAASLISRVTDEVDLQYLFRHALTHDAAYASLLRTDRRELHRMVGEVLERIYPDRLAEFAPILGEHFRLAGEPSRALTYFALAADRAFAMYANVEAAAHYRHALALAQQASIPPEQWRHLYTRCGRAFEL